MYSKWFDEYHKKFPNIQINYPSIGSGGGIAQVTAGTVDFGASDGPMTDMQIKEFQDKRGSEILHFPTVLGADVPSYNIPGVTGQLKFTAEALAGIFLGKITKWNDPAIARANPGVKLPVERHRCGSPFRWQRHHLHLDRLSLQSQPGMEDEGWQRNLGQLAGRARRQGQRRRFRLVKQTPNSIGYVELIYAIQNKMTYGKVKNAAGEFVKASLAGVTAAAAGPRRTCRTISASPSPTLRARTPTRSPASPGC